jgi:hypothetical protein
MGHDRPELEDELPLLLVVDVKARDVRRQKVGRELDPLEGCTYALREGLGDKRLADAGDVFRRTWPSARRATMSSSMDLSLPTMTRDMLSMMVLHRS